MHTLSIDLDYDRLDAHIRSGMTLSVLERLRARLLIRRVEARLSAIPARQWTFAAGDIVHLLG